jgi:hypothetical protein
MFLFFFFLISAETVLTLIFILSPEISIGLWDETSMKFVPSNRVLTLLFIAILVVSLVNTYLIFYNNDATRAAIEEQTAKQNQQLDKAVSGLNQDLNKTYTSLNQTDTVIQNLLSGKIDNLESRLPIAQYDYVISSEWDFDNNVTSYFVKNGKTGIVDFVSPLASLVFNYAISNGNSVYAKSGDYEIDSDIYLKNKKNARLDSDGATLALDGGKIIIQGDSFQASQNNLISGFIVSNGTIRIENSFRSSVAIELANTNTWTEGTRIDTVHFDKCTQGVVFRTNTSDPILGYNSTGSYGNTEIKRAYFNQLDNSVAITVEKNAEFTDGQMQNVRIWIAEFGNYNQTGLLLNANSSMYQTLLDSVVFESFANGSKLENSQLYAIKIDLTVYGSPILQSGVSFLGNWTARINNVYDNWILSGNSVFKENISVAVSPFEYSVASTIVQRSPATISIFKPKITVQGSFVNNETVTVRFRLEFLDNRVSKDFVEKAFNSSSSLWLSDDDLLKIFPSQSVIYAILVDAKVSIPNSDATVRVDLYGLST